MNPKQLWTEAVAIAERLKRAMPGPSPAPLAEDAAALADRVLALRSEVAPLLQRTGTFIEADHAAVELRILAEVGGALPPVAGTRPTAALSIFRVKVLDGRLRVDTGACALRPGERVLWEGYAANLENAIRSARACATSSSGVFKEECEVLESVLAQLAGGQS